ncbi:hypothetical protein H5410_041811 [Solanum commersonii]|uniref:Uncharacterized protein n=1 Tax=Solanum commersonii TaxID=4109 RepID=A0A9J5XSY8_SOLCO|nr:hypothetical protein H5410_041811 [Solanum commersonii]
MNIIIRINSKSRWQMYRTRTTSSSFPIIFSFRHWSFITISFRIHVQSLNADMSKKVNALSLGVQELI